MNQTEVLEGKRIIGKCPVCGEPVVETALGYSCTGVTTLGKRCQFVIYRQIHGAIITPEICEQMLTEGKSGVMQMTNKCGQPFLASLAIVDGKVEIELESHYLNGRCPLCGGRVKKTAKGYACEHHLEPNGGCTFYVNGILCNRKITDEEVEDFLSGKHLALDCFSTNEGKVFSSTLVLNSRGSVSLESRITKCPVCGADVHVGQKAYNCINYGNWTHHCGFSIWRNISGHSVTPDEARQICEEGQTRNVLELYKDDGTVYYKRLGLSHDHNQIIKI